VRTLAAAAAVLMLGAQPAAAGARVASLDQCADQYVMALADRTQIVGVTGRADDDDAWLRAKSRGLPVRRPTMESMLAARPTVVVRYWGGDERLMRSLAARGATVLQIDEATDFEGVAANVRKIARGLGREAAGEALVADMGADLAEAGGAWKGDRALYVTSGGFTAGAGTLVDAVLRAAGLVNAATAPGYSAVSLEKLALDPPRLFVKAFFEARRADRRAPGRSRTVERLSRGRVAAEIPGALVTCPAWFASEAALRLSEAAPR